MLKETIVQQSIDLYTTVLLPLASQSSLSSMSSALNMGGEIEELAALPD